MVQTQKKSRTMFKDMHFRISNFDFPNTVEIEENNPTYYINH